ncbi:hypothetical protein Ahy_B05g077571 isoform K [Arachis hypogaea]|uniref:Aminotransferase-like plant mobile domain-containing protein n=1 Tax=Arachis hypogaea TaxID=3818 RepID=A0A444Z563_ARAHY|nr:hypothetical protein Ahy_B05g077571 isoform K [Arachis hypogaea]
MHDRIIPYLERAGLYHLARLNSQWFWLDEPLVSAFVERWRPETHTFHMPFGECTVTLQDVAFQLGLPVDGEAVSGCLGEFETYMEGGRPAWEWFEDLFGERPPPNKVKQMTVHFTWFHERFRVLPPDASEETVRIYARAYIMMLLSTQLFGDKSANRVHIRWLPFVANLDGMGRYSWGSAALAWLYRCMCRVANRNVTNLAGPLQLLQSWIFWRFPSLRPAGFEVFSFPLASRFGLCFFEFNKFIGHIIVWEPYSALDVLAVVHPEILTEEHSRMWRAVTALIYFAVIEWHQVDRVVPQLGGVQHTPEDALNVDWLHAKDGRGGDRWFPHYYQKWHEHWENRLDAVISIERVADPGPSADYLDWWYREAQRFLSPGAAFADPRGTQIPPEAYQRGSSQVPRRSQLPDMPDNRRVERRRRVGTRDTGREWRWLHDAMQEDDAGGDARAEVDHRVRRANARRGRTPDDTQHAGGVSGTAATEAGGDTFTSRAYSQMPEFTPTMTMDLDDQLVSPRFYADFAELIGNDAGTSNVQFGGQSYQQQMPDVQMETGAYQPHMTEMHSQPHDYQGQYGVDLNVPAGSPLDTWFTMGGTPQSAYGLDPPRDDVGQEAARPTRVRRPARCGTGSHLLGDFHDVARDDRDG